MPEKESKTDKAKFIMGNVCFIGRSLGKHMLVITGEAEVTDTGICHFKVDKGCIKVKNKDGEWGEPKDRLVHFRADEQSTKWPDVRFKQLLNFGWGCFAPIVFLDERGKEC